MNNNNIYNDSKPENTENVINDHQNNATKLFSAKKHLPSLNDVDQLVHKFRVDKSESKAPLQAISSMDVIHYVMKFYKVYLFEDLGFGPPHNIKSIREVIDLERRMWLFFSVFVCTRSICTLYECSLEFLYTEGVNSFEELQIGNSILKTEVVNYFFSILPSTKKIHNIDTPSVVRQIVTCSYSREFNDKSENSVLEHLALQYEAKNIHELGIRIDKLSRYTRLIKYIKYEEKKEMMKLEKDFQDDLKEKLFQITKEKFSTSNQDVELQKMISAPFNSENDLSQGSFKYTDLAKNLLKNITQIDAYLDRALKSHTPTLPGNALTLISKRDCHIRQLIKSSQNQNDSKAKLITWVLCSIIAKVEILLRCLNSSCLEEENENETDSSSTDKEECNCCCVGLDSCECSCVCECHVLDDEEKSSEKEEDQIQTSSSSIIRTTNNNTKIQLKDTSKFSPPSSPQFEKVFEHDKLIEICKASTEWNLRQHSYLHYLCKLEKKVYEESKLSPPNESFLQTLYALECLGNIPNVFLSSQTKTENNQVSLSPMIPQTILETFLDQVISFHHLQPSTNDQDKKILQEKICEYYHISSIKELGYGDIDDILQFIPWKKNDVNVNQFIFLSCISKNTKKINVCNSTNITKKQLIDQLLQLPFLISIHHALHWNVSYQSRFGELNEFILDHLNGLNFYSLELSPSNIIRIDPTCTLNDQHHDLNPQKIAIYLVSLYTKFRGSGHWPSGLIQKNLQDLFQAFDQLHASSSSSFCKDIFMSIPNELKKEFSDIIFNAFIEMNDDDDDDDDRIKLIILCCQDIMYQHHLFEYAVRNQRQEIIHQMNSCILNDEDAKQIKNSMIEEKKEFSDINNNLTVFSDDCDRKMIDNDCDKKMTDEDDEICNEFKDESKIMHENECRKWIETIRRNEFGIGLSLSKEGNEILVLQQKRLERALTRLSAELYSEDCHFLFELIQNADDNEYHDHVVPSVKIEIYSDGVFFYNNEKGFNAFNIKALCDVGASTKTSSNDQNYIGQKGIGFKSVFKISDQPQIHSNGFHISFQAQDDTLGYILPHWIESSFHDHDKKYNHPSSSLRSLSLFNKKNDGTSIVLPFKENLHMKSKDIMKKVSDIQPTLLLFLHRLQHIQIHYHDSINLVDKKNQRKTVSFSKQNHPQDQLIELKRNEQSFFYYMETKYIDISFNHKISKTSISLAFPQSKKKKTNKEENNNKPFQDVFAFLPIKSYGFRFLLQADFKLPSSRECLDCDNEWNQNLFLTIPSLFLQALNNKFIHQNEGFTLSDFYSFIPLLNEVQYPFHAVASEIIHLLKQQPCILVQYPSLQQDDDKHEMNDKLVYPSQSVLLSLNWKIKEDSKLYLNWNEIQHLMEKELNQYFISKTIYLSPSTAKQLGIESFSLFHLLTIAEILFNQSSNKWKDYSVEWIGKFLLTLIEMAFCNGQMNVLKKEIIHYKLFIMEDTSKIVSLQEKNNDSIFFPPTDPLITSCLSSLNSNKTKNILHSTLSNMIIKHPMAKSFLEHLGIKTLQSHEMIFYFILPFYQRKLFDDEKKYDQSLLIKFVLLIYQHLQQHKECKKNIQLQEALRKTILLRTSNGIETIHSNMIFTQDILYENLDHHHKKKLFNSFILTHEYSKAFHGDHDDDCKMDLKWWFVEYLGLKEFLSFHVMNNNNDLILVGFEFFMQEYHSKVDAKIQQKFCQDILNHLFHHYISSSYDPILLLQKSPSCSFIQQLTSHAWIYNHHDHPNKNNSNTLYRCDEVWIPCKEIIYLFGDSVHLLPTEYNFNQPKYKILFQQLKIKQNIQLSLLLNQFIQLTQSSSQDHHHRLKKKYLKRIYLQFHSLTQTSLEDQQLLYETFQEYPLIGLSSSSSSNSTIDETPSSSELLYFISSKEAYYKPQDKIKENKIFQKEYHLKKKNVYFMYGKELESFFIDRLKLCSHLPLHDLIHLLYQQYHPSNFHQHQQKKDPHEIIHQLKEIYHLVQQQVEEEAKGFSSFNFSPMKEILIQLPIYQRWKKEDDKQNEIEWITLKENNNYNDDVIIYDLNVENECFQKIQEKFILLDDNQKELYPFFIQYFNLSTCSSHLYQQVNRWARFLMNDFLMNYKNDFYVCRKVIEQFWIHWEKELKEKKNKNHFDFKCSLKEILISYPFFPSHRQMFQRYDEIYLVDSYYYEDLKDHFHFLSIQQSTENISNLIQLSELKEIKDVITTKLHPSMLNKMEKCLSIQECIHKMFPMAQQYLYHHHLNIYLNISFQQIQSFLKDFTCHVIKEEKEFKIIYQCNHYKKSCFSKDKQIYLHDLNHLYIVPSYQKKFLFIWYEIFKIFMDKKIALQVANFLSSIPEYQDLNNDNNKIQQQLIYQMYQLSSLPTIEKQWILLEEGEEDDEKIIDQIEEIKHGNKRKRNHSFFSEDDDKNEDNENKMIISSSFMNKKNMNIIIPKDFILNQSCLLLKQTQRQEIGRWGEEYVYKTLLKQNKKNYQHVIWCNEKEESGKPYDLCCTTYQHQMEFIEVKATKSNDKPYFEISLNEIEAAKELGSQYFIYRVFNANIETSTISTRIEIIRNPITLIRQHQYQLALMGPFNHPLCDD